MLKKADDFHSALLLYRNTPPQEHTYSPAQRRFLRHTKTILPATDHHLAPVMINFRLTSASWRKTSLAKNTTISRRVLSTTQSKLAYAKPPPRHRGKPWIYGQVIKKERGRSYTIRTSHGTTIRENRVQLKPAAAAPPLIQPQTAVTSASMDKTVSPTPVPNSSKQPDVHPQSEQQTQEQPNTDVHPQSEQQSQEQPNTTAVPIPEAPLREAEPLNASCRVLKQTRSGRIIKPPKD